MQQPNFLKIVEMDDRGALRLSGEEAMALLEMALLCPCDLSLEQQQAVARLSDYCRTFLRDAADAPAPLKEAA